MIMTENDYSLMNIIKCTDNVRDGRPVSIVPHGRARVKTIINRKEKKTRMTVYVCVPTFDYRTRAYLRKYRKRTVSPGMHTARSVVIFHVEITPAVGTHYAAGL